MALMAVGGFVLGVGATFAAIGRLMPIAYWACCQALACIELRLGASPVLDMKLLGRVNTAMGRRLMRDHKFTPAQRILMDSLARELSAIESK